MEKTSSLLNFSLPFSKASSTTEAASMIDKNSLLGESNVSKQNLFIKNEKTIDDYRLAFPRFSGHTEELEV